MKFLSFFFYSSINNFNKLFDKEEKFKKLLIVIDIFNRVIN